MVGKMNSRWQSDNPVRSIGEYLPLRRRCTQAALTHRNTRLCTWKHGYVHGAETRLYTGRYAPATLYVCRFMCARLCPLSARAHVCVCVRPRT